MQPTTQAGQSPESATLTVDSMIGAYSGKASVTLDWGDRRTWMTPAEARRFAYEILKEAAYAELDECLFRWGQHKAELSEEDAAKLVGLFRWQRRQTLPICTLNLHGRSLRPKTACSIGRFLLEAAATTESEAYLMALLIQELNVPTETASVLLQEFRDLRGAATLPDTSETVTRQLPTNERLALAMTEARCPDQMIRLTRAGHYDDFKSELATPLTQLVIDLQAIGQTELSQRVMEGEFDGTIEESAAWFEHKGKDLLLPSFWDAFGA